jgi:hypothetical protein
MKGASFINIITFFQRVLYTGTQAFLNSSVKKIIGRDRNNVRTASLIVSPLANMHQCKTVFSGPYMQLYDGSSYMEV